MVKPLVQRFVRRYLAPTLMSAFTDSGHSISLELRKRRGCNRPQAVVQFADSTVSDLASQYSNQRFR